MSTFDRRGAAAAERWRAEPPQPLSAEGARFALDEYDVRLTSRHWLSPWRADAEYDIRAKQNEQERFSYATTTGRFEDSRGSVLLTLTEDREAFRRRLTVFTAGGQRLGYLVSLRRGWSIRDGLGRPVAEIHREAMRMHDAIYSARVESLENCQYVWSRVAANRYVLTIRFGPGRQLDRALALAVAPYIEDDMYRRTEWRRSWFYS